MSKCLPSRPPLWSPESYPSQCDLDNLICHFFQLASRGYQRYCRCCVQWSRWGCHNNSLWLRSHINRYKEEWISGGVGCRTQLRPCSYHRRCVRRICFGIVKIFGLRDFGWRRSFRFGSNVSTTNLRWFSDGSECCVSNSACSCIYTEMRESASYNQ